jgi:AIG2-like family
VTDRKLYWAYGANLNVDSMARRCPGAEPVAALVMPNGALVFRGVADVVVRKGSEVHGGLWWITPACERSLDRFEGVSSGLYLKRELVVRLSKVPHKCLFYQMAMSTGVMPPSEHYLDTIAEGYRDFGLDLDALDEAVQESWVGKKVTSVLRRRYLAKGSLKMSRGVEGNLP